ncbi:YxeA family protein [Caldalkalibacillus mannanilyticus]|uniref:YxeA family protein n=1 Tax=Caldalkalibacillus mannanilyticus TaxID=1418 RepID=UPI000468A520|nr:YxeA family protein [Caldalkalibacillus mannanilyticus]
MKKKLLILGSIILIGVCLCFYFFSPEKLTPDHPAGKNMYYTMIIESGVQGENGRYDYKLPTYNEEGKERELVFSARKQLREGAYVQLYHTFFRGVTYWKEVGFEELPEAVQQQYQK